MRVTTKGRYALRAIINLARDDARKPVSIKAISRKEGLSPIFLEQIFTKLKSFGLVRSVRGAGGGFVLARKPEEITVLDVLEAVEEGLLLTPCCYRDANDENDCSRKPECTSVKFWQAANDHFKEYLSEFPLDRVMDEFPSEKE